MGFPLTFLRFAPVHAGDTAPLLLAPRGLADGQRFRRTFGRWNLLS